MSNIKNTPLVQLASDAAGKFVESYYRVLNDKTKRSTLASYYTPDAAIVWQGNPINGGPAFASFFTSMPNSVYDVQSFDAHPTSRDPNASTSILLSVSGSVRYGEGKELRTFSDTILLQPEAPNSTRWRIATQGFRIVSS